MSDELFPEEGGNDYEYEDEDEGSGLVERIKDKIAVPSLPEIRGGDEEEEDNEDDDLPEGSVSFLGEEDDEEETTGKLEKLDRFTVLVVGVEVVLVMYLLAAILGLAPFF